MTNKLILHKSKTEDELVYFKVNRMRYRKRVWHILDKRNEYQHLIGGLQAKCGVEYVESGCLEKDYDTFDRDMLSRSSLFLDPHIVCKRCLKKLTKGDA